MYLKSIEMQGFKSFANKIILEFHDGITGIVGPNGSGKSNVADAVRWVLGEQSARQLRGGNMQDVIFSGTETRRPLGFASVAITLDNGDHKLNIDYEEVTVTRRLYRSGESEYLLNGRNCRLRDIQELFYDTGIGREGYSIIGQGQVDRILSGKPEERRELFDEAAGIVKFKRRKAATLKKLNEEQQNLVRVTDILSELTRQLGPLEKQAEKARIYLQKREELKSLEINLFLTESEQGEKQQAETERKKKAAEEELAETTEAFEQTKKEYEEIERRIEELDGTIQAAREKASGDALKKQQLEGQINVLREQIHAAEQNREHFSSRLEDIRKDTERRQEARRDYEQEKLRLEKELQEAAERKEKAEAETRRISGETEETTRQAEEGRSELISLLNRRSSIKGRLQRYDTMLEQTGIRKSELTQKLLHLKSDEERQASELARLKEEFDALSAQAAEKKGQLDSVQKQTSAVQRKIEEENRQMEIGQTAFHREESRLESLKNITERYEGYGFSIKKVMEQKEENPGIHGVVADLIKTEKKYETAIETALGGSLQNIVTDNENTAKYLIEYLKRGRFGRATFLPLTAMNRENAEGGKEALNEEGVIGTASDLVQCDRIYRGIVSRLLGRTLVVDTIDHAIRIGRKHRQSLRMVTLEGELLSPGGSMTGGSFRNNSNLLGRRREIEELESSVRTLQKEMTAMQAAIAADREKRNALREQQNVLNEELQKLYLRQNTARINLEAAGEKAGSIRLDCQKLQTEGLEIENQIGEIGRSRNEIEQEMQASRKREAELEEQVAAAAEKLEKLREQEQKASEEQQEALVSYSGIRQKRDFLAENLRASDEELQRLVKEQEAAESSLREEGEDAVRKQKDIGEIRKTIEAAEKAMEEGEKAVAAYLEKKEAMNRSHKEFFRKRDELSEHRSRLDKECFRLEAQLEKLEEARDAAVAYLWEEYRITPDQTEQYGMEERPERGTLKKQITGLKDEIKGLGDVNVNAIEDYRELQERHGFLAAQHEDLVRAAETLQGIIDELDRGMRRQFTEKFEEIRLEFDRVFRQLFGGGRGTLELAEDEDVLEAGIRIISQPPGKKLQNMMQLSGGEKALTAIALLFAIQNLKPSPFCLLDEIEAALDDSNVGRFAKYLHKLTKNTQFIIITHRRGTMTAADRLYGITMQEKGVSTLVSVNLIEGELDK
jgi:chromosome segregation protein